MQPHTQLVCGRAMQTHVLEQMPARSTGFAAQVAFAGFLSVIAETAHVGFLLCL